MEKNNEWEAFEAVRPGRSAETTDSPLIDGGGPQMKITLRNSEVRAYEGGMGPIAHMKLAVARSNGELREEKLKIESRLEQVAKVESAKREAVGILMDHELEKFISVVQRRRLMLIKESEMYSFELENSVLDELGNLMIREYRAVQNADWPDSLKKHRIELLQIQWERREKQVLKDLRQSPGKPRD
jgi:hypothetical protein